MIMAKKPAPVQLSGLGYFDTLGLPEGIVDGFLADEVLLPLGEEEKFLEPLFRLPIEGREHYVQPFLKTGKTARQYPRKSGTPSKEPLGNSGESGKNRQ